MREKNESLDVDGGVLCWTVCCQCFVQFEKKPNETDQQTVTLCVVSMCDTRLFFTPPVTLSVGVSSVRLAQRLLSTVLGVKDGVDSTCQQTYKISKKTHLTRLDRQHTSHEPMSDHAKAIQSMHSSLQ